MGDRDDESLKLPDPRGEYVSVDSPKILWLPEKLETPQVEKRGVAAGNSLSPFQPFPPWELLARFRKKDPPSPKWGKFRTLTLTTLGFYRKSWERFSQLIKRTPEELSSFSFGHLFPTALPTAGGDHISPLMIHNTYTQNWHKTRVRRSQDLSD